MCSSDLIIKILKENLGDRVSSPSESRAMYDVKIDNDIFNVKFGMDKMGSPNRSEERRVGKECRSRWSTDN